MMAALDANLRAVALAIALAGATGAPALAQVSSFMRDGLPGAEFIPPSSESERAAAVQRAMRLPSPPRLRTLASLTPNRPYAEDGSRLHFWKPSFVIGSPAGGEAGVNFWGLHNEGHINVGFTPRSAKPRVLDCRLLSAGPVTYRIYVGDGAAPGAQGEARLSRGRFLLVVPIAAPGVPVSVELWPTPVTETMGFLGCDISEMD
jgi:hypothetical protein